MILFLLLLDIKRQNHDHLGTTGKKCQQLKTEAKMQPVSVSDVKVKETGGEPQADTPERGETVS